MSSIWNKNVRLFSARFPALSKSLNLSEAAEPVFDFWEVTPSKNGEPTAKEHGLSLHSAYNPIREAQTIVKSNKTENVWCACFFSMGLGYGAIEWAKLHPQDTIIIAEPVPDYFFAALKYIDFEILFNHQNLILALQAGTDDITSLIERSAGFNHTAFIENNAQKSHAEEYFKALRNLIERNKKKVEINNSTLEKFSKLWLKNSCRNLHSFTKLDGVNIYKDKCPEQLPALLLAAGPTLSQVLPHLKELKKRCLIIAVDTSLRACLKAGVEPDFIVLADPQYYAWRHIAGLKSPSSVLITESAAYPPCYRFDCRKIVLCSSLFPLGQYFEKRTGEKGELGAGGSVATTAWDFARLAGAKEIYCAGLDLGYPLLQSHIRGSLFEESSHRSSNRLSPSEQKLSLSLFSANGTEAKDYAGNTIFTDDKMKLFAWWFESKAQEFPSIKSYSLSQQSLAIPLFNYCPVSQLLLKKEQPDLRKSFFNNETVYSQNDEKEQLFTSAFKEFSEGLEELYSLAKKGLHLAEEASSKFFNNKEKQFKTLKELEKIDYEILHSQFKETASLVFPGEKQLNRIFSKTTFPQDEILAMFVRSKIIYKELMNSINSCLNNL